MVINIHGKIPADESLFITVNNETKILDNLNPVVSFNMNDMKSCEIGIEQKLAKSNRKLHFILLFLLTAAIQGLFNILLINSGSDWYNNIKAYCLKARLTIDLQQNMDIHLTYRNSKYDDSKRMWSLPIFTVDPNVISNVSYVKNPFDFKNQYFNYVKRVLSVAIVLITIFTFLLYIASINLNIMLIIFILLLMFGTILLVIIVSISQYKKLKVLYQFFLEQNRN